MLVPVLLVVLAAAVVVRLLLAYARFRRLELALPGPPSLPLLGNTFDVLGVSDDHMLVKILSLWGHRHAELSRISVAGRLMVFVSDPAHLQELFARKDLAVDKDSFVYSFFEPIGHGVLSLNGEKWRVHRRAFQPAFHQNVLDRYSSVFSDEALGFVRRVRPGEAQDVEDNLQSLLTRSFLQTSMASEDVGEDAVERLMPDLKSLVQSFTQSFLFRIGQPWLWPSWAFGLTPTGRKVRGLKAKLGAFLQHSVISARREQLQLKRDRAKDCEDDPSVLRRTLLDVLLEPGDRLSLSNEDILDEVLLFGGAAILTTVATLSWVLKTLSLRPDVQERILQEVEAVLGKDGATPINSKDLDNLAYTERVVKETIRLLPTLPFVAREVKQQTELGGHTLPAGSSLVINFQGVHRHPGHWPDPLRFDPDRFLPERSQGRHPYAFLPFGAGPRACIGSRYGMMLMKTFLATLVPRYHIDPVDDGFTEPADFPMAVGIVSRMVGGARVVFTPRVDCTA